LLAEIKSAFRLSKHISGKRQLGQRKLGNNDRCTEANDSMDLHDVLSPVVVFYMPTSYAKTK
jgi:hypothetical protein